MRAILLTSAAFALMGMAPTGSSVISVGGSSAASCYHAAVARDTSRQALGDCNSALGHDVLPMRDLVASYVNRGVLRLVLADYRSAESDFDQAMALEPTQAEAWLNKGIARYQQGDAKAAVGMLDRAVQLGPIIRRLPISREGWRMKTAETSGRHMPTCGVRMSSARSGPLPLMS